MFPILLRPWMHIPDGFLSTAVSIIFWILSLLGIGFAIYQVNREKNERRLPLMGVLAAAIFAAQMLNFTVVGGTSGHLLGAALAAILVGPWAAVIVMASVVGIQALVFQDGGLLAMGANLFNMSLVGVVTGGAVYSLLHRILGKTRAGVGAAGFVAAWASVVMSSLFAALQLVFSGTSPFVIAVPAMAGIHALIGIGEGLITLGALIFLGAVRKDLVDTSCTTRPHEKSLWVGGTLIALLLAFLSPLASSFPDGLESVAEHWGFIDKAQPALYNLLPDYQIPWIHHPSITTISAGIAGVLLVLGVYLIANRCLKNARKSG